MTDSNKIHLGNASTGEAVYIDIVTLVSTRLLVTASSGGGKSETLRRILEQASEHIQCIVLDPEGEFSTLREKRPFVLIGEGGEAAADVRTAALVATRLLELNASAVCDLYEMRVQDRHEWVRRFLDSMVHAPKSLWHPVLIIIDEAHTFAPEKGSGESVASQSVIDIANLGRKRGFCLIPATQRLSKLSKNVVEPMQNYLVGRTTFDDQARAASVFKIAPGAETRKFSLELEQFAAGQFIARGRAITGDLLKVQVIRGETRPPVTGTAMAGIVTPTPEAIKALLPKLADLPHEAEKEASTIDELRRDLALAKRDLAAKVQVDPTAEAKYKAMEIRLRDVRDKAEKIHLIIDEQLSSIATDLSIAMGSLRSSTDLDLSNERVTPLHPIVESRVSEVQNPIAPKPVQRIASKPSIMSKACRAIMTALAQHGSCSKSRIAALTGYAVNGGGFNNAISECRTKFWLTGSDPLTPSHEGLIALGDVDPLPTGRKLLLMWDAKLGKAEREILGVLASRLGSEMDKQKLADLTGYAANGGGFNNAISRLRTLELVEGKGALHLTSDFANAVQGR
jgi:hypothetical protein